MKEFSRKKYGYLGMDLNFLIDGYVRVTMKGYLKVIF